MQAGGELAFDQMKLQQLKEELAARGSTRTGLKAVLQRRLHGLQVDADCRSHLFGVTWSTYVVATVTEWCGKSAVAV